MKLEIRFDICFPVLRPLIVGMKRKRKQGIVFFSLLWLSSWWCAVSLADDKGEKEPGATFETEVLPIFEKKCVGCHNPQDRKAELDLSSGRGLFQGGESGQVVDLNEPEESLLYEMVHEGVMPPEGKGERLTDVELHALAEWIATGSLFADGTKAKDLLAAVPLNQHDIQPIMLTRCTSCHGGRIRRGDLDLRTRAAMLQGGKSGPAIVLGKPTESLLLKRIHAEEMPPRDQLIIAGVKPITSQEVSKITQWITAGAPTKEVTADVATSEPDTVVTDHDRQHWSFRPLPAEVAVPQVPDAGENPIDAFVLRKLKENQLAFNPEAERAVLLRRVSFDLTGLPPTPTEVMAFLENEDPQAYEEMVDALLRSPRYGERWGRFWLDAAGYADSEGKRSADPLRKYAYRYRDYVIRAFNADKPYSRFLLEQIAGDELADYSDPSKLTPEIIDNLIATGFLRMAPDGTGSDVVNTVAERMEVISDEIDILGSTVLGLTLKCARCHSHKYDAIPHRDYYRLVAVFQGAYDVHDWLKPISVAGQSDGHFQSRALDVALPAERAAVEKQNQEVQLRIDAEKNKVSAAEEIARRKYFEAAIAELPEAIRADVAAAVRQAEPDRSAVQKYLESKFTAALTLTPAQVKADATYQKVMKEVAERTKALESEKQTVALIRALWDRGEPSPTYIFRRGDHREPGRLVGPGVPSVLTNGRTPFELVPLWDGAKQTGRRRALAEWLIEPDHPLTARVMVNRIWKHHLGQGIVASVDNFGKLGDLPTHPELLDWLAREFVNRGWSMKQLHRLILTSKTYRQSSFLSENHLQLDPENRYVSRMPLRRMDAEEVRDTLIFMAGALDETPFGEPDSVDVAKDGLIVAIAQNDQFRRSVYLRQRRKEMPTFLETFDLPQMNPACQGRATSNVAQQALYLLNNQMVRDLSKRFAGNVGQARAEPIARIQEVYLTALGRPATSAELEIGQAALGELEQEWTAYYAQRPDEEPGDASLEALRVYSHTILNSAAFLYIE